MQCAKTLAFTIQQTTPEHPFVLFTTPSIVTDESLPTRRISKMRNPNKRVSNKNFRDNYTILNLWNLTEYDRVIAVDADVLVTQSLHELCMRPLPVGSVLAADNWWTSKKDWDNRVFNGGLMVFRPSAQTYAALVAESKNFHSSTGGVQPFLNHFFSGDRWIKLDPLRWGVNANAYTLRPEMWDDQKIHCIHYTTKAKPCHTSSGAFRGEPANHPYVQWHRADASRREGTGKSILSVVCATKASKSKWGSYERCRRLALMHNKYGQLNVTIRATTYEEIIRHDIQFDIGIALKTIPPKVLRSKRFIVDIVDDRSITNKSLDPKIPVILQDDSERAAWTGRRVFVLPHMLCSYKHKTYQFIHPTKTGGTALEKLFAKYYSQYIRGRGHRKLAHRVEHPIVVVRDPVDRALSAFKYWKYGSSYRRRSDEFLLQHENVTFEHYLQLVESRAPYLLSARGRNKGQWHDPGKPLFWLDHYLPTSHWIRPDDYSKSIVIQYANDLNYCLRPLFQFTGITDLNVSIDHINVNRKVQINVSSNAMAIIRRVYVNDFQLLHAMSNEPHRFAYVINNQDKKLKAKAFTIHQNLALSVHEKSGLKKRSLCMKLTTENVLYDCIETKNSGEESRLFRSKNLTSTETCPRADLFNQLYRLYDVLIVYDKGKAVIQRMINAMNSGVATVVQNTGVHRLHLNGMYPCIFEDEKGLNDIMSRIHELKTECKQVARQIVREFQPRRIIQKYDQMFEIVSLLTET
jgi:lipopolysaccharide biosynthesis glycosyltransferase